MLIFHQTQYDLALQELGVTEKMLYPYKELLTSEMSYVSHFLDYLNDDDISELLKVYEQRYFRLKNGEMTQSQLRLLYNSFKELRDHQRDYIEILYKPEPQKWLQALNDLQIYYLRYLNLSDKMVVPLKVDLKFKQMQNEKMQAHFPQLNGLADVLIAPVQRLPRYALLGKEILKALESRDGLLAFKQGVIDFIKGVRQINQQMNDTLQATLEPKDIPVPKEDEALGSPYLERTMSKRLR